MSLTISTDRTPRPPLPTTREEMRSRGWDAVDVVLVSGDAYVDHPSFANGLIAAAEAGATAIIQPGGSIRDKDVIAAADERGLAMVFTGMRHFRH